MTVCAPPSEPAISSPTDRRDSDADGGDVGRGYLGRLSHGSNN